MASYYKKYMISVQKNQSTSQDDVLTKPDPTKIINLRHGSYDKLNDSGYAPEETKLENGDVIFGKITPIVDVGASGKSFRDSSEVYHMHAPGVVDRVYIDIQNQEGYLTREALVRSERIPKIGDKYSSCYDGETEILTDKGWIYFKQLTKNYKVATLVDGDTLTYQTPLDIICENYKGKMYCVKSNQVDLLVTPNHRMYVRKRDKLKYELFEAKEIFGKHVNYKKNAEKLMTDEINIKKCEFLDGEQFILPEYHNECVNGRIIHRKVKYLNLDAFVEFLGIWYAEGCADKGRIMICAHKERVKNAMNKLEKDLGFKLYRQHRKEDNDTNIYYICDVQWAQFFSPLSVGAINKKLPKWVWLLDQKRCRILLQGMILGDGHYMKYGDKLTSSRYDTSSKQLADDFQRLCIHCGYSANITLKKKKGTTTTVKSGSSKGNVIIASVDSWRITVITTQIEPRVNRGSKKCDKWVD